MPSKLSSSPVINPNGRFADESYQEWMMAYAASYQEREPAQYS